MVASCDKGLKICALSLHISGRVPDKVVVNISNAACKDSERIVQDLRENIPCP